MPVLLILLLAFVGLVVAMTVMARVPPQTLSKIVKQTAGLAALGMAGLLLLRGRIDFALGLGALGLWLLGVGGAGLGGFRPVGSSGPGVSRVRSAMIEMELDHATGSIEGEVLAGPFEGRRLADLTRPQCEELHRICLSDDPEGARLLEAYLDRRFPGWRPAGQRDDHGRSRQGGRSAAMTEDEAYEILGLHKGASREEVARAHRSLMKKLHPDHGGSTSLAARVNEAKEILMRRHH